VWGKRWGKGISQVRKKRGITPHGKHHCDVGKREVGSYVITNAMSRQGEEEGGGGCQIRYFGDQKLVLLQPTFETQREQSEKGEGKPILD